MPRLTTDAADAPADDVRDDPLDDAPGDAHGPPGPHAGTAPGGGPGHNTGHGTSDGTVWLVFRPLADFLHRQASAGIVLVVLATVAIVWANSPWWESYATFWANEISISVAGASLELTFRAFVNDALMTVFFFVAGLEIKREVTTGELRHPREAALPLIGAVGGMVLPALIYLAINLGEPGLRGWGIPIATDIAIVMGVIALLSSRVPSWLKLYLLALAIVDDIGAILVIAVFYSGGVSFGWLAVAAAAFATAMVLKHRVRNIGVYVALGVVCWFALHEAHVHPTLAGVAFGVLAPNAPRRNTGLADAEELLLHPAAESEVELAADVAARARDSVSVVEWLVHRLHPFTAFVVAPVFALANAGVHVPAGEITDAVESRVFWGVLVGLVVGKTLGVFGATMLAVATRVGTLPPGVTPRYLFGASALAGIGFTVSLFVSQLAFDSAVFGRDARLAVLVASVIAAGLASAVLIPGKPPSASAHRDTSSIIAGARSSDAAGAVRTPRRD